MGMMTMTFIFTHGWLCRYKCLEDAAWQRDDDEIFIFSKSNTHSQNSNHDVNIIPIIKRIPHFLSIPVGAAAVILLQHNRPTVGQSPSNQLHN